MDFNLNMNQFSTKPESVPLEQNKTYDVLIIGGGPAAMTAAVYCIRKGLDTGLITQSFGGQVAESAGIENFMGYKYIEGLDLVAKFKDQIQQFEIAVREGYVAKSMHPGKPHQVILENGENYQAKTLIIATGKSPRRLNAPGEKEFQGRGVAYCATCDAPFYKGKKTAVIGGGNSGMEAAIDLAKVAEKVTLIQRNDRLRADDIVIKRAKSYSNFEILFNHQIKSIQGNQKVESLELINTVNHQTTQFPLDGVFIEIGLKPNTDFVKNVLKLNEYGEIIVDCACRTSEPGIFAAGDVTTVTFKQIIIAAGEGAKAALTASDFLLKTE
ncbi:MAG: FAD-dependent oxidoreductase [Spirochaetes bacterium]|nr:FAD-dependent oxidoreductase [Spirochaetota bacterium]